jgi:ATP-dependent DNA helicase RecG
MNKRLTAIEIESIVHLGEGYNAEFKIRVPNKVKELSEEVCAFANSAGGVVLIGVSDDNVIHGVEIDNAKRSAIQNSLNEINPHSLNDFYSVDINSTLTYLVLISFSKG